MTDYAARMLRLFAGNERYHGTHGKTSKNDLKGGKLEIKKTARTEPPGASEELWDRHLSGERPLGIIPIRMDNTCVWGCIDVDQYDVNHGELVKLLADRDLPMVVCRTKSGGAHLFAFMTAPVQAEEMRAALKQVSASLGLGDCEIFPKQNQILVDRGDMGNWLNMPYLDGDKTNRYGIKKTGSGMTLAEFLDYAEQRRCDLSALLVKDAPDETLDDGPPCLQHLAATGFPEGSRNNGLFALGVFCKKKFGDRWKEMLEKFNTQYMRPPLPAEEVAEVISRLDKTDYNYSCKNPPIVSHCNSSLCRTRRYGVGGPGGVAYPVIAGMSKLNTDPPIWFVDIEDRRVALTTAELQNYRMFHAKAMDVLTITYGMLKQETWLAMVGAAMAEAHQIDAPPEMSVEGQFNELLTDFLLGRHRGDQMEDLLLGRPWFDEETKRHYFRLRDLMQLLKQEDFKVWGRNMVGQHITDTLRGGKHFFNIKGAGVNVFWVPDVFRRPSSLDLPTTPAGAI